MVGGKEATVMQQDLCVANISAFEAVWEYWDTGYEGASVMPARYITVASTIPIRFTIPARSGQRSYLDICQLTVR